MTYDEWLDATYQETWEGEGDDIRMIPITNRMIMDCPPDGWFNPWTLTDQEIDKMREEFVGSGYKWRAHVESHLPNLCPKKEKRLKIELNKIDEVKRCGSEITWIDKKGMQHKGIYRCKHYDICIVCQSIKEKEHFNRLMQLDGCQVIEGQRAELAVKFENKQIYSFKLQDGREVSVVSTDEKIGTELNYQLAKELSKIAITGNRVSGKLGKEISTAEKPKELESVTVSSCVIEASKEVKRKIEAEYLQETKDFLPKTLDELVETLKKCNSLYFKIAKRHCDKIHFIGYKRLVITEFDLDWTDRPGLIEDRLKLLITA